MRVRRRGFSHARLALIAICSICDFNAHSRGRLITTLKRAMLTRITAIHALTDTCFRKCIPMGNVKNGKLDKYEEPCMRQCVDRFLDANLVVLRELERLRQ
ncbi:hypothetical protein CC86DRAFT_371897 [Ophiobolus disseminans]|uniref:Mitochondrial import inner membrane translocase subunit n=1 Tax=Ophiobolus disseminans TaxID=1469910 RepID=A0A6A6ZRF9_9PLEO|nr:hypothetical protein CC86DRAFT_371897 [Ophiobolus disseminans]